MLSLKQNKNYLADCFYGVLFQVNFLFYTVESQDIYIIKINFKAIIKN